MSMRGKRALRKETAERKGQYPPIPKGKRKQKKEKFFNRLYIKKIVVKKKFLFIQQLNNLENKI